MGRGSSGSTSEGVYLWAIRANESMMSTVLHVPSRWRAGVIGR